MATPPASPACSTASASDTDLDLSATQFALPPPMPPLADGSRPGVVPPDDGAPTPSASATVSLDERTLAPLLVSSELALDDFTTVAAPPPVALLDARGSQPSLPPMRAFLRIARSLHARPADWTDPARIARYRRAPVASW